MKKIFTSIFILIISVSVIISFSLLGCTGETTETTETETQEETTTEEAIIEEAAAEGPIFLGLAAHGIRNAWEDLYVKGFQWYCDELGIAYTVTESGYDAAMQITQAKRIIDMGVDGLIISPWDMEALSEVMDYAEEKGVPVICTNTAVNSSYPLMFVGYGARRGGVQLAEAIVEYLGDDEGTVLELSSGPGTSEDTIRGGGFHEVIDQYADITVITQVAESDQEKAKTLTLQVLQSGETIDAVFAQNGSMALGANSALQEFEGTDPKDVFIATVDAFPAITTEISAGNIDIAVDQTPAFYNPIAVHYMLEYLEKGESALPAVGDTITTDDLTIGSGNLYFGVDPWAEQMWAPAEIKSMTEYGGITEDHLWFATNAVTVTADNADSGLLWGNFPFKGW